MKIFTSILLILLMPHLALAYDPQLIAEEQTAMDILYGSVCNAGCTWNKNGSSDACGWDGVGCITDFNNENLYVSDITLINKGLSGQLPSELGAFSELHSLFIISNNNLTGSIPKEIGNLLNLEIFLANDNQLSGQLPDTMQSLPKLSQMEIYNNQFEGIIPGWLNAFNSSPLWMLNISGNNWSCPIPDYSSWATNTDYVGSMPCLDSYPLEGIYKGIRFQLDNGGGM